MKKFICGVDLGGTKISTGIVDGNGKLINSIKVATNVEDGPDAVINRITMSIKRVLEMAHLNQDDLLGIGIGSPGPLDIEKGLVVYSSNLPGWRNIPIVNDIRKEFKVPVKINNDGNAAALGEYLYGSGKNSKSFIYITVSTGIGGGAVFGGKLFSGTNSNALEVGHMTIEMSGPKCGCGNYGCFEAWASGTAIAKTAQRKIEEGHKTIIADIGKNGSIKAEHIFEAARNSDKVALEIVDMEGFYLGIGIANIINLFNPDKIALGGGVSSQMHMFYDKMIETISERALKPNMEICEIVKAELGNDIGIIGAASLMLLEK